MGSIVLPTLPWTRVSVRLPISNTTPETSEEKTYKAKSSHFFRLSLLLFLLLQPLDSCQLFYTLFPDPFDLSDFFLSERSDGISEDILTVNDDGPSQE